MTVHVVVPVFNRLQFTQAHVRCLRQQKFSDSLHILIVDDGSTDGTSEWLEAQDDIEVLEGDGTLFWGGAVDLALQHLFAKSKHDDWVLLINNDTTVADDFVQLMLNAAQAHAPAVVGCVIRDETDHERLLSIGVCIDAWRLRTMDLLDKKNPIDTSIPLVDVDALSGRGVLFPVAALVSAGGMRPYALPHYLADYEVSMRARKAGWRLIVLQSAAAYSPNDFGSTRRAQSWRSKLFSVSSPLYLPAFLMFWWGASSWMQRLTLPLRMALFVLFPRLRKSKL